MNLQKFLLRGKLESSFITLMEKMGVTVSIKKSSGLRRIIVDGCDTSDCDCTYRAQVARQEIYDFLGVGDMLNISITKEKDQNLFVIGGDSGLVYKDESYFFHQFNRYLIAKQDSWMAYSLEKYFSQFESYAIKIKLPHSKDENNA